MELFVKLWVWPNCRSLLALEKKRNEMNAIQWKYQIIRKGIVWRNFHFEGVCVIILCIHLPDDDVWGLFYWRLWFKKLNSALAVIQLIDKVQQKSEVKMHRIKRTPNSSSLLNIHNCFSPMKFSLELGFLLIGLL